MDSQLGVTEETFPTLGTLVGFLSRVFPYVSHQIRTVMEAFPTLRTRIGLLPRVRTLVPSDG